MSYMFKSGHTHAVIDNMGSLWLEQGRYFQCDSNGEVDFVGSRIVIYKTDVPIFINWLKEATK